MAGSRKATRGSASPHKAVNARAARRTCASICACVQRAGGTDGSALRMKVMAGRSAWRRAASSSASSTSVWGMKSA
jgi:hypothetical protein